MARSDHANGFLLVNPLSGRRDRSEADELCRRAQERGVATRLLQPGDDAAELARDADAPAIGVAGGDGSLAPIAGVAIERDLPFVCVPAGTRNHFARDLGLDTDDSIAALEAFAGRERRVDVGLVNGRVFLNNVSLGIYGRLVHQREQREPLASVRAIGIALRERHPRPFIIDGGAPLSARVVLVANNSYELDLFSLGERPRLDEGKLHLYAAQGLLPGRWHERVGEQFRIGLPAATVATAVDGEPVEFEPPLEFELQPRALRVLVPPGH
jgi:diacylglycerol kinase family enzyme